MWGIKTVGKKGKKKLKSYLLAQYHMLLVVSSSIYDIRDVVIEYNCRCFVYLFIIFSIDKYTFLYFCKIEK
jgi:hypothetical protein